MSRLKRLAAGRRKRIGFLGRFCRWPAISVCIVLLYLLWQGRGQPQCLDQPLASLAFTLYDCAVRQ